MSAFTSPIFIDPSSVGHSPAFRIRIEVHASIYGSMISLHKTYFAVAINHAFQSFVYAIKKNNLQ